MAISRFGIIIQIQKCCEMQTTKQKTTTKRQRKGNKNQIDRHTCRQTGRYTHTDTDRQSDTLTHVHSESDRQTGGQTGKL